MTSFCPINTHTEHHRTVHNCTIENNHLSLSLASFLRLQAHQNKTTALSPRCSLSLSLFRDKGGGKSGSTVSPCVGDVNAIGLLPSPRVPARGMACIVRVILEGPSPRLPLLTVSFRLGTDLMPRPLIGPFIFPGHLKGGSGIAANQTANIHPNRDLMTEGNLTRPFVFLQLGCNCSKAVFSSFDKACSHCRVSTFPRNLIYIGSL